MSIGPAAILLLLLLSLTSCPLLSEDTRIHHERTAGDQAFARNDLDGAERHYKVALDLSRRNGNENSNFILAAGDLARLYSAQKREPEAEELFRQRIPIADKVWAQDAKMRSSVYYDLALFYLSRHRYTEGKPVYDQLMPLREQAFGQNSAEVADTLELFAQLFRANDHPDEATSMGSQAKAIRRLLKQ
jgi:tetratricopeptide (TPR) repeat protein